MSNRDTTEIRGLVNSAGFQRQIRGMHRAVDVDAALNLGDKILGGHGVEYIADPRDCKTSHGISYVNMGDPYIPTVMYDHNSKCFRWGCYGDLIERHHIRFGE